MAIDLIKEKTMEKTESNLRVRPRFRKQVSDTPEIVKEKIKVALDIKDSNCIGNIVDNHVILKIPSNQQHYWSPQLGLELEPVDGGTLIRGLFGPKPDVWTMFVFFYSALGFLSIMGLIFGLSQMMLKMDPYGMWLVPVGVGLLVVLYIISRIGQKLGRTQINQLNDFLETTLGG